MAFAPLRCAPPSRDRATKDDTAKCSVRDGRAVVAGCAMRTYEYGRRDGGIAALVTMSMLKQRATAAAQWQQQNCLCCPARGLLTSSYTIYASRNELPAIFYAILMPRQTAKPLE